MAKIERIKAREILDTKGNPTVEAEVRLDDGTTAASSIPTGALIGTYEAQHVRDGDKERYGGLGVMRAIDNINNEISPKIVGIECSEQQRIDKVMIELDGTQNKIKLGVNAILPISQAVCKAAAKSSHLPLVDYLRQFISLANTTHKIPTPMFNIIEGGKHADNALNFQEFLVIPASSHSLTESMEIGTTIYKKVREYLLDNNQSTLTADEGGFAPAFATNADALRMLKSVIEGSNFGFLKDAFLGLDVGANSIISGKKYVIKDRNGQLDHEDILEIYQGLVNDFSLVYVEDPFAVDDWDGWKKGYTALSPKVLVCGDEVISTNPYRLQAALNSNIINAVVIKPSQIGTVTEALAVSEIARFKQLKLVVSARSGETDDDFIADFAVAIDADYVKFGAPARERIDKYNRLTAIDFEINKTENLGFS